MTNIRDGQGIVWKGMINMDRLTGGLLTWKKSLTLHQEGTYQSMSVEDTHKVVN